MHHHHQWPKPFMGLSLVKHISPSIPIVTASFSNFVPLINEPVADQHFFVDWTRNHELLRYLHSPITLHFLNLRRFGRKKATAQTSVSYVIVIKLYYLTVWIRITLYKVLQWFRIYKQNLITPGTIGTIARYSWSLIHKLNSKMP